MNFDILSKSGVSKSLFADVIGVSHASVCHWIAKRCSPHPLRAKKIKRVLNAIERAVECGDLPATVGAKEDPTDLILAAIAKQLDAARAPK